MICEAYDVIGDLCAQLAGRVVEVTWPHEEHRVTIQARLCEEHYQTFKDAFQQHPTLTTTEGA